MAYVNNGTERSLKVSVDKQVGGNPVQGYPKTYDGQQAFPGYLALSDDEFRQLSEGDFTTRYNAFVSYVEIAETGADFDTDVIGDGAIRAGAACVSTTTTTDAVESYSFAVKYGTLPVDACNGTIGVCYSAAPIPGVGSILYKDESHNQRWDLGAAILFVSPALYGTEVASVAVVAGVTYEVGEIMTLSGYNCTETQTTTVPVTTIPPVTTVAPSQYYLTLYRCDTADYYKYGPVSSASEFTTGMRVEGATDVFYVVTAVSTVNPSYTAITGITFTGSFGCL